MDGFGIDDVVDVFETIEPFTIGQDFINKAGTSEGNYFVNLTIRRMILRSFGIGAQAVTGWVSSNDPIYNVYSEDIVGPPLVFNESFRAEFDDIDPELDFVNLLSSRCGLFEAILTVDNDGIIDEINEQDNQVIHYFFIPSDQVFDLKAVPATQREVTTNRRGAVIPTPASIVISPVPSMGPTPVFYKSFKVNGFGITFVPAPKPNPMGLINLTAPFPINIAATVLPTAPTTSAYG